MKNLIFLFLICFSTINYSQTIIDIPVKSIYACLGEPVQLPRVRIITDTTCLDSSLINPCAIYTAILAPTCGCDQQQYLHYDIASQAGLTSNLGGICPSQLSYWQGGNGGVFTNNQLPLGGGTSMNQNVVFYTPSILDFNAGLSTLYFSANGVSDSIIIYYTSGVNLGPNKNICTSLGNQIQLNSWSDVPFYNQGFTSTFIGAPGWSGGLGTYSPSTFLENPNYSPTLNEINTGYVDFTFNNSSIQGTCQTDTVRYFFISNLTPSNQVDAGNNIYTCTSTSGLQLNGSGNGYSQILWQGSGSFLNPNSLSTSYFPSIIEQNLGFGDLVLTSTDINSCAKTDTLHFRFNTSTKIDVLNNFSTNSFLFPTTEKSILVCNSPGNPIYLGSAIEGISNGLLWTTNGNGVFSNISNPNTSYSPSNQDYNSTFIKVYLQSLGCNNPIDSLKIKIQNVNNLTVNYGTIPTNITCGEIISVPTSVISVTGIIPWGNPYNLGCYYQDPINYSFYSSLDGGSIPVSYSSSTGYLYNIGPLTEGTHQIITYMNTGIPIGSAGGGLGNQIICSLPIDTLIINVTGNIIGYNDTVVCQDNQVVLWSNGVNNILWNNNVIDSIAFIPQNLGLNEYIVSGIDSLGCIGSDTVNVLVIPSTYSTQIETALDSYNWPVNGDTFFQSGIYIDTLINSWGCDSIITLDLTLNFTGLNQENTTEFNFYPNPATDQITINGDISLIGKTYLVFDQVGKVIYKGSIDKASTSLSVNNFSNGVYTLQIDGKGRRTFVVHKD